jgi:hypothetical protein
MGLIKRTYMIPSVDQPNITSSPECKKQNQKREALCWLSWENSKTNIVRSTGRFANLGKLERCKPVHFYVGCVCLCMWDKQLLWSFYVIILLNLAKKICCSRFEDKYDQLNLSYIFSKAKKMYYKIWRWWNLWREGALKTENINLPRIVYRARAFNPLEELRILVLTMQSNDMIAASINLVFEQGHGCLQYLHYDWYQEKWICRNVVSEHCLDPSSSIKYLALHFLINVIRVSKGRYHSWETTSNRGST